MLSICITLALGLSSCDNSEEAQMGFKIISTDVNDFSLQVPEDWTVTSQNGYVSATAVGEAGDESNISVMSTALKTAIRLEHLVKVALSRSIRVLKCS